MEQIILYLAILAALSGFGMGLMNLAGPWLRRSNLTLPSLGIASGVRLRIASLRRRVRGAGDEEDDEYGLDDDDDYEAARGFAENSFAPDPSLLAPRRRPAIDDEELDEELAGVLDEVAEEDFGSDEDEEFEAGEEAISVFTVAGTVGEEDGDPEAGPAGEDGQFGAVASAEDDELLGELDADDDGDDTEFEDEDDEEDDETEEASVQVVAAAGGDGDDLMSFFDEASDAGAAAVAAWRDDLPEVTIEELLTEAQAVRAQIRGKKPDAA